MPNWKTVSALLHSLPIHPQTFWPGVQRYACYYLVLLGLSLSQSLSFHDGLLFQRRQQIHLVNWQIQQFVKSSWVSQLRIQPFVSSSVLKRLSQNYLEVFSRRRKNCRKIWQKYFPYFLINEFVFLPPYKYVLGGKTNQYNRSLKTLSRKSKTIAKYLFRFIFPLHKFKLFLIGNDILVLKTNHPTYLSDY